MLTHAQIKETFNSNNKLDDRVINGLENISHVIHDLQQAGIDVQIEISSTRSTDSVRNYISAVNTDIQFTIAASGVLVFNNRAPGHSFCIVDSLTSTVKNTTENILQMCVSPYIGSRNNKDILNVADTYDLLLEADIEKFQNWAIRISARNAAIDAADVKQVFNRKNKRLIRQAVPLDQKKPKPSEPSRP